MIERRKELRFLLEAGQAVRIADKGRWQNFQRDLATELRVAGAIDFAHPAGAENSQDFVQARGVCPMAATCRCGPKVYATFPSQTRRLRALVIAGL